MAQTMQTILLGIGALGLNLPALVAQLVSFTLLLVVFRAFLYKPVIRMLDERKKRIQDRKSTRLNSSHVAISYAVFCLKKKNQLDSEDAVIWQRRRRRSAR